MRRRVVPNRVAALSIAILVALATLTISGVIAATASATETRSLTSSADTRIVENAPTKNYGAAPSLGVNGNVPSGSGKDKFALLKWDLSAIAPSTQIDSALVTLSVTTASPQTYQAYVLKQPWIESEATWNVYSSGKPWEVAGAKGSLDKEATVAGSITPSVKGKNTLTLPLAVVQGWVDNPATNQGIIITNPSSTREFNFDSREVTDPTRRPQLTLDLSPATTPPETTIASGPSGTISSGDVSFTFSSDEAGSTFECSLDGGAFATCTTPTSLTGLSNGSHTFDVRATDGAGNVDATPASRTFTVDVPPPPDTTPPETTVDSGPSGTVSSSSADFAFSSDEAGSTFECSLDSAAYTACTSPESYSNLPDGSHSFRVRATDAAANTDATPASRSWIVDTTAPGAEGVTPQDGATGVPLAYSIVATFSEDMDSSTINGSTTFTLTKQGANEPLAAQVSYDSATKKATLHPDAELESGTTYTAMLKGGATGVKDLAGNPLATNKTWFFSTLAVPLAPSETSPPETTIDSGPADGATLSSGDVSFTFSSSEPNSVFECSADGGAYAACTSPKALSKLSNGQHSFAARATDVAGNTDATPATRSFTVSVPTRVNVLDYGATPNDSINDSAAFEDAMDAAGPGEVVYVPPASGAYRLFNIHPPSDTTLQVDSGATLKKFGSTQGPLFKVLGPDDNTFVTNVHFEGVSGGDFTIDIADAGQETGAIVFQNVKGFSVKHFRCVQNNSNQLQEAPSSRRPCLSFIASNTTQRADGTYNQPTDGTIEDAHAIDSPYGWGLVQTTGAANVTFSDISGNGGAVLRLENFSNGWTPMKNLTADGVTCTDGHDAVHMNPHGVTHLGSIYVTNVVADSCESAVSEAGDGTYGPNVTIDGVTVIPGNTAQDRDPAKDLTYVGAWLIGPSVYCINDRTSAYNVNVSNVNCGLPNT